MTDQAEKGGAKRKGRAGARASMAVGLPPIRLPDDLGQATRQAAEAAGMTVSDYTRWALRQAVEKQGASVELAAIEGRMAASLRGLHTRVGQMQQAQQIQMAFVDLFIRQVLVLLPDFPDDASRSSGAIKGRLRYEALEKKLPKALDTGLAAKLKELMDGVGDRAK